MFNFLRKREDNTRATASEEENSRKTLSEEKLTIENYEEMSESENSELTIENYKEKLQEYYLTRKKYAELVSDRKVCSAESMVGLMEMLEKDSDIGDAYEETKKELCSLKEQIQQDNKELNSFFDKLSEQEAVDYSEIENLKKQISQREKNIQKIIELKERTLGFIDKNLEVIGVNPIIIRSPEESGMLHIDEVVKFGRYQQDDEEKTPIEWVVKAVDGSKAFLVSRYALETRSYNWVMEKVTWEKCALRSWLNQEFYTTAFRTEEQKLIAETIVTADKNPVYDTDPGNDTKDKVFLLSIQEAEKCFKGDKARKCVPTAYAVARGAWTNDDYKTASGKASCLWWLRSPGDYQGNVALVDDDGSVDYLGCDVLGDIDCVRPALWIDLES